MTDCLVQIRTFQGDTSNRALGTTATYENVRCRIGAARTEVAAFYESLPVGQLYEFALSDSRIAKIPDGAEFKVTSPQGSGLDQDAIFIAQAKTQRQKLGGKFYITGVLVLKES